MGTDGPRHSVSVAAAIVDGDGSVLAARRRDNNRWEPPGGVLELHETIQEGLIREVQEETGLLVEPTTLTGIYKNMSRGIIALVFRCRILEGELGPTHEAAELRWMMPDEIRQHMQEAYSCRMLDALDSVVPVVRAHDGMKLLDVHSQ